jgi:hypothetical protein
MRVKIASIIVFLGLASASSSTLADTTAVYKARSFPLSMTVEIADSGNVRYQMSNGRTYGLVVGNVDYFVTLDTKGPLVDRVSDLLTAQKEVLAPFLSAFRNHEFSTGPELVATGTVTINGRIGEAYAYDPKKIDTAKSGVVFNDSPLAQPGKVTTKQLTESQKKEAIAATVVVISNDPDLAQLGKAMAKQFGTSQSMLTGMVGDTPAMLKQMGKLLQGGAPLSFAGMELQSVNHAQIDPKRFELPAEPETIDQIRSRMKPLPPPPTASTAKP